MNKKAVAAAEGEAGLSNLEATNHDIPTGKTNSPPPASKNREIYSSKQHLMDYVTTEGIIQRTGHTDKEDWYLLIFKELQDNAVDFERQYYPFSSNAAVDVDITLDNKNGLFHYKVTNTNPDDKPVFKNIRNILDYHKTFGSKQNKHVISAGQLGDALKQVTAFGYALMREQYDKSSDSAASFGAAQWTKPMIIRANGKEHHITIKVDDINSDIKTIIDSTIAPAKGEPLLATQIENTIPLLDEVRQQIDPDYHPDWLRLDWVELLRYWKQYMLFTTDITFRININDIGRKKKISESVPALHGISPKWNNKSSIFWYTPKEFRNTVLGVHFKQDTTLYELLQDRFREASLLPKTPDLDMTISEFIEQAGGDEETLEAQLESLYCRLREVEIVTRTGEVRRVEPPARLSLPYDHIGVKARKIHLTDRMVQYVGKGKSYLNTSRSVYKLIEGQVKTRTGKYIVQHPFAIEIIVVPISPDILIQDPNISSEFFGAINYSISPKGNDFEGNYEWDKKEKDGSIYTI